MEIHTAPSRKKKEKRPAAAVITLSAHDECPRRAIRSVLGAADLFSELHLVSFDWDDTRPPYADWEADRRALEGAGVHVVLHYSDSLDETRVRPLLLINVPPDVRVARGPLEALVDEARATPFSCCWSRDLTHWALRGRTVFGGHPAQSWLGSAWATLAYGFLMAFCLFDWARERYMLGTRYSATMDVSAQSMVKTFGKQHVSRPPGWWTLPLFRLSAVAPARSTRGVESLPHARSRGWALVLRYFGRHEALSWGLWWFSFAVYYFLFAVPWWAPLAAASRFRLAAWLVRDPTHPFWVALLLVYLVGTLAASYSRWDVPLQPLMVLLAPVYLAALPVVILYARFYTPRGRARLDEKEEE